MQRWTSEPLRAEAPYSRADLYFQGIDHRGDSFIAFIYLDNPDVSEDAGRSEDARFAGEFTVFGHGRCWGDEGHCSVTPAISPFDASPPPQLARIDVTVTITDALQAHDSEQPTITVLAFPLTAEEGKEPDEQPLDFERLSLVTYE